MGQRQPDQDKIIWQSVPFPIGGTGLDLRTPTTPGALTKLINARFRDERTVERRLGYSSIELQDASDFANGTNTPEGWLYGHGQLLTDLGDAHFPIAKQGKGVFKYGDTHLCWTGDRLLIAREGTSIGSSPFWSRGGGTSNRGIPAYLPVQTDNAPPDKVTGDYVETCLTETLRVVLASTDSEDLIAWVIDRATGAVLNRTDIVSGGDGIYEPRVINSGDLPVAVWLDGTELFISWWSGIQWSTPSVISDAVTTFEVAEVSGGFALAWQTGGVVKVGRYTQHTTDNTLFDFGTALTLPSDAAGALAFAVAPNDSVGLVWQDAEDVTLWASTFGPDLETDAHLQISSTAGPWDSGISCCFRAIEDEYERHKLVVHAGNGALYTQLWELAHSDDDVLETVQTDKRYRTKLASKSFRIGDEVFCWLQARNSETNYLAAGVTMPQVCGIADREDAVSRIVRDTGAPGYGVKGLPMVYPDPLDEHRVTWIRPFNTTRITTIDDERSKVADLYVRAGNCRIGDMNFLPPLCAVQYGESVYFAGSHVRNWDGMELGDAGFHDYPLVSFSQSDGAGALSNGVYQVRAYPVRYNKRGERFQGSAITESVEITGANDTLLVTAQTVPVTNHDDLTFEIWRTEAGGTTFYLDGVVTNDLAAGSVSYTCTLSDAALRLRPADPHAPGIGIAAEVEELGPLGCEILAVSGDRLWGAGGQVPGGFVQFSKLKEPGEAAGFDPLAGYQEIDIQGARITSMIGYAESMLFFSLGGFYQLHGAGPNNYGSGGYSTPQLNLVDGAVTHLGTGITQEGPVYWGVDGPRLMRPNSGVVNISAPVRLLTKTLTPSGVQIDFARQEVVWFTEDGNAVLWNYQNSSRWAQWKGLKVAGCCNDALMMTNGRLFQESAEAYGDGGAPFTFAGATGELNSGSYGGDMEVNRVGVAGVYEGEHELRLRIFYNGSPLWSEQWIFDPRDRTWLTSGAELESLTPEAIDDLGWNTQNGSYAVTKKANRHSCRHFRVEWSDINSDRPTYRLFELSLEVGSRGGTGRAPVQSFGS